MDGHRSSKEKKESIRVGHKTSGKEKLFRGDTVVPPQL
jgi:hypothetical protein